MELNPYPHRVPVTRLSEVVTGRDAYGNDVFTPTRIECRARAVWPLETVESDAERSQVISGWKLLLDAGTAVAQQDRYEVAGQVCEVTAVQDWTLTPNPWTGEGGDVEVTVRRVTG